jgi:hypothetical protein
MRIRIGKEWTGRVERCAGQRIDTEFLVICAPVFPIRSRIVHEAYPAGGVPLPAPYGKSVVAAYLRWISAFAALAAIFVGYREVGPAADPLRIGVAVFLAAGAVFSFFLFRRAPLEERLGREILHAVTGYAFPPSVLPYDLRIEISEEIAAKLPNAKGDAKTALEYAAAVYAGDDLRAAELARHHPALAGVGLARLSDLVSATPRAQIARIVDRPRIDGGAAPARSTAPLRLACRDCRDLVDGDLLEEGVCPDCLRVDAVGYR